MKKRKRVIQRENVYEPVIIDCMKVGDVVENIINIISVLIEDIIYGNVGVSGVRGGVEERG